MNNKLELNAATTLLAIGDGKILNDTITKLTKELNKRIHLDLSNGMTARDVVKKYGVSTGYVIDVAEYYAPVRITKASVLEK